MAIPLSQIVDPLENNTPTKRDTSLSQLQEESNNNSVLEAEEVLKVKCSSRELSVSLSRIDSFIKRFMNKDKPNESIDELKDDQNGAKIAYILLNIILDRTMLYELSYWDFR